MTQKYRVLAIIAARKNSKRLPNKHLLKIKKVKIIDYVIRDAQKSKLIDQVCVSTDDEKIMKLVHRKYPSINIFERPPEFATDTARLEDAIRNVVEKYWEMFRLKWDIIVILQGNSPFKKEGDIDKVIKLLIANPDAHSAVSVTNYEKPLEWALYGTKWARKKFDATSYRTQTCMPYYYVNGSIQAIRLETLMQTRHIDKPQAYLGEFILKYKQDRKEGLEIDTKSDLDLAKYYLSKKPLSGPSLLSLFVESNSSKAPYLG